MVKVRTLAHFRENKSSCGFLFKLMTRSFGYMNETSNQHPVVCFGEMLWDILPSGVKPGGAPMNVAYHLQKLGLNPAVISRVGTDSNGEKLLNLLQLNGITSTYVQQDGAHQTGVVLAQLNARAEATYDIVQPVAWDFIESHDDLKKLVAAASYFVFGSLASRNDVSRATLFELLELAKTRVLDINLRAPHFSQPAVGALLKKCELLKVNDQELQLISGWYGNLKKLEDQMRLLQDRFQIPTIVTTCGGDGAALLNADGFFQHPGFAIKVRDTVGSGDAFLAALLHKFHLQAPAAEALLFANRLGAFIATRDGACPVYSPADVEAGLGANVV